MAGNRLSHSPAREELVERARAFIPTLRERALAADRDRGISRATHEAFCEAGFYKIHQPARYGGLEMPLDVMIDLCAEIGRGCGSSAWVCSNLAGQGLLVGMHAPSAQDDVWKNNPDALIASSFPFQSGSGKEVTGGLLLNGTWSFASGVDFADWENLQVFLPGKNGGPAEHRFVLVPKADFTIKDDWHVTGLSGTGSRSVVLNDVFVPEHRVLDSQFMTGGPSPGSAASPGPLFKVSAWAAGNKLFTGPAIGIARGALDLIEEDLKSRITAVGAKLVDMPTAHARIAEAGAEIDAAYALMMRDSAEAMQHAESGERPPIALRAKWRRNNAYAGQLCLRAVERLYPLGGGRGLRRDNLFQLAWRDIHAACSQILMTWDTQSVNTGRVQLGLPSLDPRL
jgi:3-hydroxy-9,10-secoandrosta-1,3,5(10)-triene-9,17-dione monooxygenase